MNPLVVWASDLHINSTTALCVPVFEKDDGNEHHNSKLQNALWGAWLDAWKQVKQMARGREVVTVLGGEIADELIKHPGYSYITHNTETIRRMALETIDPALQVTDKLIVLRGTEAHSGYNANLDEGLAREIAEQYDIEVIKDGKRFSHWYLRIYIGGRLFDLAHHVSMGTSRRTERNAANQLAADLIMDYVRHGDRQFPDFAIRGHVHRFSDSADNYIIRALISGAWQMHTTFTHRIAASAQKSDIGLLVIDPATRKVKKIRYEPKREAPKHISR